MPAAEIQIEILEDGQVLWNTGKIPDAHHSTADELMADLEKTLGGPVTSVSRAAKPRHTHHHDHEHVHEHGPEG